MQNNKIILQLNTPFGGLIEKSQQNEYGLEVPLFFLIRTKIKES